MDANLVEKLDLKHSCFGKLCSNKFTWCFHKQTIIYFIAMQTYKELKSFIVRMKQGRAHLDLTDALYPYTDINSIYIITIYIKSIILNTNTK
jgi:hypothetical protein